MTLKVTYQTANMKWSIAVLVFVSVAFASDRKEYKKGIIERWDTLNTGTSCKASGGLLGVSAHCASTGAHVYHVVTEEGFDYTVQPDTYDPFKAMPLGQEIEYRMDEKGVFWTPDPHHGSCPFPCTSGQKKEWIDPRFGPLALSQANPPASNAGTASPPPMPEAPPGTLLTEWLSVVPCFRQSGNFV
jgi:hypothetical protein